MRNVARLIAVTAVVLFLASGAAALDINTSDDLRYFSGEEAHLWVESGTADTTFFGDLHLDDSSTNLTLGPASEINNFFTQDTGTGTGQCETGQAIQYINPDGTYSCADLDQAEGEGDGAENQVAVFEDGANITSYPNLYWDHNEDRLGVDVETPSHTLDVGGDADISGDLMGSGNTLWDSTEEHVPTQVLEADNLSVDAGDHLTDGGEVDLGGSITLNVDGDTLDWEAMDISEDHVNVDHLGDADANLNMNEYRITDVVSEADGDAVNRSFVTDEIDEAETNATQDLFEVLDEGDDADGEDMVNIGQVGIGTDDPSTGIELDVEGDADISGTLDIVTDLTGSDIVDSTQISGEAVTEDEIDADALGDALTGGDGTILSIDEGDGLDIDEGSLIVGAGTGIDTDGTSVSIDEDAVAQLGEDETIDADLWTFEEDLRVEGDLDVWGNVTNTDVENLNVNGSLLPPADYDGEFDVGDTDQRWNDGHFAGTVDADTVTAVTIEQDGEPVLDESTSFGDEASSDVDGSYDDLQLVTDAVDDTALDNDASFTMDGLTLTDDLDLSGDNDITSVGLVDGVDLGDPGDGITIHDTNDNYELDVDTAMFAFDEGSLEIADDGVDTDQIDTDAVTDTELDDDAVGQDELDTEDVDDHYLRRDGTDAMEGDLDMGDNNIDNVDCIGDECSE